MATRWKNMTKRIKGYLKRHWKEMSGILLFIAGLFFFYILIIYRRYYRTKDALLLGSIGNILSGLGGSLWLGANIRLRYRNWIPQDESFYDEWKQKWKRQQTVLNQTEAAGLLFACWFFSYNMNAIYGGYYINYASGYILFITVLIQFGIYRGIFRHFMRGKLNLLMERMSEINRQSLKNALEIERKSLEKVSRSDQLKVDLITNVSHDLKTPLTSMVGYIELMKKEELNDTARDYVDVISEKAQKLKEMIESLFSLAKASSGNIELHMESIELNRLIEQIFADMEDQMNTSELQFVTQLTGEDTGMVTDNMHLYRICQNLIENALKYSAKGTRVFVKTYIGNGSNPADEDNQEENEDSVTGTIMDKEERLCMEITNTAGYFMDFDKKDIVERFARADKARSSDGNGLGLAIVSTYTSALGGEFDILIDCDQFKAKLAFPRKMKE